MTDRELPAGETPVEGAGEAPVRKPVLRCPRCGAGLVAGERYCPDCGLRTDLNPPLSPQPASKPFSASWQEIVAAFAVYLLAWWYLWGSMLFFGGLGEKGSAFWTLVFTLGFVALAELLHWRTPRPRESWIWLGCLGAILLSLMLWPELDKLDSHVWDPYLRSLFLHLAAVWWLLSRSGRLCEGRSGHLLPLDGIHGFLLFPFKHFYLRIRTVFFALRQPFRNRRRVKGATLLWSCLALLAAAALFVVAAGLLMDADKGFDSLMGRIGDWFRFDWNREWIGKLLLSLPVGQYLFGLLAGTGREEPEKLRERGKALCGWVESLRKVPNLVWTLLTGAFCLLYLLFFAVQSRYLFGAFTRTLPEGFIVSQYAREGFFELCKVMAVNFALLWLVSRMSRTPVRETRPTLILCLILLAESLLFAVVAFSKIALYIDCFGFTPLRLQSSWLVCVLFVGCLAFGWNLLTGKKSMRAWMVFSAVTLSALCLV